MRLVSISVIAVLLTSAAWAQTSSCACGQIRLAHRRGVRSSPTRRAARLASISKFTALIMSTIRTSSNTTARLRDIPDPDLKTSARFALVFSRPSTTTPRCVRQSHAERCDPRDDEATSGGYGGSLSPPSRIDG
jgi:hypothetical protein